MTSIDVLSEQLEFVATVIDGIQAAARRVGFRPDDMAQIYAIALHLTIVELLAACFLLAEKQQGTGIPILLRSMYEAFVDLENLVRDASYVDHIDAANLKQSSDRYSPAPPHRAGASRCARSRGETGQSAFSGTREAMEARRDAR